mmetsp:Transcript_6191/g.6678  ORF Transcript_6191/g.6678 Transcript_6191/m.6678 type:complete len:85 (+) Transcript_6191:461-715(+)
MVKSRIIDKQVMVDIASGKSKPLVCSRRAPTIFKPSVGYNNNNNNKGNNNHNTKKKKAPSAAKSTLNAIIKAGTPSKHNKRSQA